MNNDAYNNPYLSAADAAPADRARFIRSTYMHVAIALLAFAGLEAVLINSPIAPMMLKFMGSGKYSWLIVLGLFMGVSWLAQSWANSGAGRAVQYAGLALYIVAEAIIFLPLIAYAVYATGGSSDILVMAAMITGALFLGLTAVVMLTRVDFSFLRGILIIGGFVAFGIIAAGIVFGFNLGLVFSGGMLLFAAAAILYNTSNIFLHYRTDQDVAASLTLFASIALMFWYVLNILLSMRR